MGMYATLYAIYVLFDYTYNLILRTGQSPISSDNRLSTVRGSLTCLVMHVVMIPHLEGDLFQVIEITWLFL